MKPHSLPAFLALLGTSFLCLCPFSSGQKLIPLREKFTIQTWGEVGGICDWDQFRSIGGWWNDCYEMTTRALAGLTEIRNGADTVRPQLRRYLLAFFNIRPDFIDDEEELQPILNKIRNVVEFMTTPTAPGQTHRIFCGSQWLIETEKPYFPDGTPYPPKRDGKPWTIRDAPLIKELLQGVPVQELGPKGGYLIYLYWSREYNQYEWQYWYNRPGEDADGNRHFCVPRDDDEFEPLGEALEFSGGKVLTFCPQLFDADALPFDNVRGVFHGLSEKEPGEWLQNYMPRSFEMLLELIQVVNFDDLISDVGFDLLSVLENRENKHWDQAVPLVYLVYAYYLSVRHPDGLDWSTGFSRAKPPGEQGQG